MEISGEVDITIDQYADFEIDLDTDRLAEVLLDDHEFVSVTTLHGHVRDYCDDYFANAVSERVDEELAERDATAKDTSGLTPEELIDVVNSLVDERLIALFTQLVKGA
jgi:hypothetical protein